MKNRLRDNFFQGANSVMNNKKISLSAKGLYSFLCSKPDDWDFNYKGMKAQLKEKDKAIRSAVRELVSEKILVRGRVMKQKKDGSKYSGFDWILHPTEEDLQNIQDPMRGVVASEGSTPIGHDRQGDDPKGDDIVIQNISNKERSNNDDKEASSPILHAVEENRRKAKAYADELRIERENKVPSFSEKENPAKAMIEYLKSSNIEQQLQKYPSYMKLNPKSKTQLLKDFISYQAPSNDKGWKSKNDLCKHIILYLGRREAMYIDNTIKAKSA